MSLLIQKIIRSFEFASIPPELANDFWLHLLGQCLKDSEVAMQRLRMWRPTSSELLGNLLVNNYAQLSANPTSEIYKSWYLGQSSAAGHRIGQFQGGNNIREHDTAVYLHDIQAAREGFRLFHCSCCNKRGVLISQRKRLQLVYGSGFPSISSSPESSSSSLSSSSLDLSSGTTPASSGLAYFSQYSAGTMAKRNSALKYRGIQHGSISRGTAP